MRAVTILRGGAGVAMEAARHLIRRPTARVAIAGRDARGRWLLVRTGDEWDVPRATLAWNETIHRCVDRQLAVANARIRGVAALRAVYSMPGRRTDIHAVTIVVSCELVSKEDRDPRFFSDDALPTPRAADAEKLIDQVSRLGSGTLLD